MYRIVLAVIVAIPCVTVLIMLSMVLGFAKALVEMNKGDTRCLRDVAILLRAFRAGPNGLLTTLIKTLKRS
jgi:hypothetical protein